MECHAWVLITRSNEVLSGEDDYPTDLIKLQARTFILKQPNAAPVEIIIPEGFGLVFKRRVQMIMSENTTNVDTHWKFLIGIEPLTQERSEALHGPGT